MSQTQSESSNFAIEANFDGLVGPSHNYAGLSFGNVASMQNQALPSNPREAALQGLAKAWSLASQGFAQGIIPPQPRPDLYFLKRLGFSGPPNRILKCAFEANPLLVMAACSASSMWTANSATVSPSADCTDGRVHFTSANLIDKLHRAIEADCTHEILKAIFNSPNHFVHHPPLPGNMALGDEGAANHTRLSPSFGAKGVEFFVFGRKALGGAVSPRAFPARQTFEASTAVARMHGVFADSLVFAQQNPDAIDAGAFHNDVVGVGSLDFYFYHEKSLLDAPNVEANLNAAFRNLHGQDLRFLKVLNSEVSLTDAIKSYLFNSQILQKKNGDLLLVAPLECQAVASVKRYLSEKIGPSPLKEVQYFDLKQSMQNGGGPACLRLRVVLQDQEAEAVNKKCWLTADLHMKLVKWIEDHYRDRLHPKDLVDITLYEEGCRALDELTQIMGLGSIYPFQK